MAGFIAWQGFSALVKFAAPVVAIVTLDSVNRKTGPMAQAWILRSDMHPLAAVRAGLDDAICGDCRHRGTDGGPRSCYVTVQHGPAAVYRTFKAGGYPHLSVDDQKRLMAKQFIRFGAYGDPAAVPYFVWRALADWSSGWTGYTHVWPTCDKKFRSLLMASVDNVSEYRTALAAGWRTFRIRQDNRLQTGEIVCPASAEAGHASTCQQCRICSGTSGRATTRSVAIYPHGPRVSFFRSSQELLFERTNDV